MAKSDKFNFLKVKILLKPMQTCLLLASLTIALRAMVSKTLKLKVNMMFFLLSILIVIIWLTVLLNDEKYTSALNFMTMSPID